VGIVLLRVDHDLICVGIVLWSTAERAIRVGIVLSSTDQDSIGPRIALLRVIKCVLLYWILCWLIYD
jgi:hypothetical protein